MLRDTDVNPEDITNDGVAWCAREGCPARLRPAQHRAEQRYCSTLCLVVDTELRAVERAARRTTDPDTQAVITDEWTTVVALSDLVSEYRRLRVRARQTHDRARRHRKAARRREAAQ